MARTLLNSELRENLNNGTWRIVPDKTFCANCYTLDGDDTLKYCSRCRTRYCSKECQTADWPGHKVLCKLFAETKNPEEVERGSPLPEGELGRYRRVIFFHPEKEKPEIIWGDINDANFEKKLMARGYQKPNYQPQNEISLIDTQRIEPPCPHNFDSNDVDYQPDMYLIFRTEFQFDGSRPNNSLAAAVRAGGNSLRVDWRGPIYLCREGVNVSMADYVHACRFLSRPVPGSHQVRRYQRDGMEVFDMTQGARGSHGFIMVDMAPVTEGADVRESYAHLFDER